MATERRSGLDHLDEPQPPRLGRQALGMGGRDREGIEGDLAAMLDARPQALHRDGAPAGRRVDLGAVDLPIEAAATGGPEAARERLAQRPIEGGLDLALGVGLRERRHLVLQAFEVARERSADHVRPRRQELTELHVSRAEACQSGGEPVGRQRAPAGRSIRRAALRAIRAGSGSKVGSTSPSIALAGEHQARATEPGEMRRRSDHNRQPECSATMPPVISR